MSYHHSPPVEHRLLGLDKRDLPLTLLVFAVVLLWAIVMPAIDAHFPRRVLEIDTVLPVGRGFEFRAAAGWQREPAMPSTGGGSQLLYRDGVKVIVKTGSFEGDSGQLLDQVLFHRPELEVVSQRRSLDLRSGLKGKAVETFSPGKTGALLCFAYQGTGIQVEVQGPSLLMERHTKVVADMVGSFRLTEENEP